ncbi:MAG: hypothetical protein O2V44_01965 [Candidatus Bathyarchaeota archaeon]|nr:hypothetical protein [Candidatus Bathyarchaeota archaeon]
MKCQVIVDTKGEIISVGYADPEENEEEPTLRSGPEVEENQKLVEFDVPAEYAKLPTVDFIRRLQIDIQARSEKTN